MGEDITLPPSVEEQLDLTTLRPTKVRKMTGRKMLVTSESEITESNVCKVLNDVLPDFYMNQSDIRYLWNYYKGDQPVYKRQKAVRPEIKNIVLRNHAREIVEFKMGHVFGDPVQYVSRGSSEITDSDDVISEEAELKSQNVSKLNEFMISENRATVDTEVAEWVLVCGVGFKACLPDSHLGELEDDSPFEIMCLDSDRTFAVYHSGIGSRHLMTCHIINQNDTKIVCVYTPKHYFEVVLDDEGGAESIRNTAETRTHSLGHIPIVEYVSGRTRLGSFEDVITLLDAINVISSNRLDGLEQFVQSFMKFVNCDIDEESFTALKEMGAIRVESIEGKPADVDIVTSELNQSQTQVLVDDLYQNVLAIVGMPDRKGASKSGADTGASVELRDGWAEADARAKTLENNFRKSEHALLKVALNIMKTSEQIDLSLSDIDIKFTRNKTANMLVKTQGMMNMFTCGIAPRVAISHSGLFNDPEQVYKDSIPYLSKWDQSETAPGKDIHDESELEPEQDRVYTASGRSVSKMPSVVSEM